MNDEQRRIVENSAWIVNTVLQRQGLAYDEDLRQEAYLHLCRCVVRFDESRGIKWDTYAYSSLFLHIKKINGRKWRDSKRDETLRKSLDSKADFPLDACLAIVAVDRILNACTDSECLLLECMYNEMRYDEIAKALRCTVRDVSKRWKALRQKLNPPPIE